MNDHNPSDLIGLLEGAGFDVPFEVQQKWTKDECAVARRWAVARWSARSPLFQGYLESVPGFLLPFLSKTTWESTLRMAVDLLTSGGAKGRPCDLVRKSDWERFKAAYRKMVVLSPQI